MCSQCEHAALGKQAALQLTVGGGVSGGGGVGAGVGT
jgi:hypothetical protein